MATVRSLRLASAAFSAALCSACADAPVSGGQVKLGVLLPYTGEASALSANLEKGSLLAADEMNLAGGVGGVSVEVIFGNTFSDPVRAAEQAQSLVDRGAMAIVGPGDDEVDKAVFEVLVEAGVPLFSPLASAAPAGVGTREVPWFRMAPTAKVLGQNLAKLVGDSGNSRVAAVVASDVYHSQLAAAFVTRVAAYASVDLFVTVDEGALEVEALAKQLSELLDAGMQGVMLAMHPRPAARLATELAALRGAKAPPAWYLTPRLKTELLLQNASPGSLRGAVGIAPQVFPDTKSEFERRFEQETGDLPFDSTFYVYDATTVALIAIDRALARGDALPAGIAPAIQEVASFGGVLIRWADFEQARAINQSRGEMQYIGLTGPVILTPDGSRSIGTTSLWGVEDGVIVER